jgi:hypothetical protein
MVSKRVPKIHKNHNVYGGNFWAIVLGHKDKDIAPLPLREFVKTCDKKQALTKLKAKYPGRCVRAILQPWPPEFKAGM